MYVFDMIYFMDIIFSLLYKYVGWMESKRYYKPKALLIIVLDIISTVPSEYLYIIILELDTKQLDLIYCLLRLRSVIRIYRIVMYSIELRQTVGISLLALSLCEFGIAYYLMLLAFTVMLSLIYETRSLTSNMVELMSYIVSRTIGLGFNLIENPPEFLYLLILPFTVVVYLLLLFAISLSTCALLQRYRPKMIFANMLNIWIIKISSHFSGHSKDAMIRALNTYALSCWKKNENFRTDFEYDKIITHTMSREIKLDLCFNALKHANLFRKLDTNILRYIATLMSVTFLTPGELVYRKHKFHTNMIYIITGIVQLLSQEDGETPILSFSGGTVLGETSLFISHTCPCTVMCKSYCEIVILKKSDFFKISKYYPEEYYSLLMAVKTRYVQARLYVSIFNYQLKLRESNEKREVLTLKWLKSISKKLYQTGMEETEIKRIKDRKHEEIFEHCLFVTYYIDQIVLTEDIELNTQAIMYKKTFPIIFLPNTVVSWLWDQMIAFLALVHAFFYIFHVCISQELFNFYGIMSMTITILWGIDVYLQISTAIRTKDKFMTSISEIITIQLKTLWFWVDCVAAFPIDILVLLIKGEVPIQDLHLYQVNRLFKCYRLFTLFSISEVNIPQKILQIIKFRFCTTLVLITINMAGIFYLKLCPDFVCSEVFEAFLLTIDTTFNDLVLKLVVCLYLAIGILTGVNFEYLPIKDCEYILLTMQLFKIITYIYFVSELTAVRALEKNFEHKISEIKRSTLDVSKIWAIDEKLISRMMRYLEIFSINKNLFYNATDMSHQIPSDLYKINVRNVYRNLHEYLPILKYLPENVLTRVYMNLKQIVIPPREIIVYYGEVCTKMYIIEAGCCKIFFQNGNISKILGPGDTFCVYEACKRTPTMVNVTTLTHCKVVSLDYDQYIHALAEYPYLLEETRQVFSMDDKHAKMHDFTDILDIERDNYVESPSFKYFGYILARDSARADDYYHPFEKNDLTFYFKYALLRVTFHCNGKFVMYWEISRCIFALLSVMLSPMAVITAHQVMIYHAFLVFLDITAYLDIYVRHHISYYNNRHVEVTHPLNTAIYYWKHALIVDLTGVIPVDKIIPYILRMEANTTAIVLMRLNRLLQFYRTYMFFKQKQKQSGSLLWVVLMFLISFVFMINIIASLLVVIDCKYNNKLQASSKFTQGIQCEKSSFLYPHEYNSFDSPYSPLKIQCLSIYFVTSILCGIPVEGFRLLTGEVYVQLIVLALIGMICIMHIKTTVVAWSLLRNVELINFQNLLYELIKFLNYRNIDVKLKHEVIEYYEYLWMKKRGKTEQALIKLFHSALQEDVMYDMYGKILHHNSVFTNASKGFYKSLLHYVKHRVYLNLGIILRVNLCHSKIFFLVKGTIDVLGPDYSRLILLPVGSMFGSLDKGLMRQTLTMVAKGHVELLVITNVDFHNILSQYNTQKEQYKQLTYIHVDYLLGTAQRKKSAYVETRIDNKHKKRKLCKNCKCFRRPKFFKKVYQGKLVKIWKLIVLFEVCFFGYMLELYQKNSYDMNIYLLAVLYTLDVIFIINIYISFHVAYYDEFGIVVTDLKLIGNRYMKKKFGFWMDIFSCIPADLIAFCFTDPSLQANILTHARWNRVVRVIHIIRYFAIVNKKLHINVLLMRTVYLLIWIIVITQMIMNIFFLIATLDESLEYYYRRQPNVNMLYKYIEEIAVIVCITCGTKVKNFLPNNPLVILTTAVLMVLVNFLIILILGEVCATMEVITAHKYQYEADINELRRTMINDDLAMPLQERAWQYCKLLWINNRGKNFPPLLKTLPYYLKEGILNSMFGHHLRSHPVLKKCHINLLMQVSSYLRTRIYVAGDYITFMGDIDGCMFFIEEGDVTVIEQETVSKEIIKKQLSAGDMFGFKQGIYPRIGHKYTYQADTYCFILQLKRDHWIHLLDFYPASQFVIYNAQEYLKVNTDE